MPKENSQNFAASIRRIILERAYQAHVGHIGSALSVTEIIAALYSTVLNIPHPAHPQRDYFILSKGHAALALYAAFFLKGWLANGLLNTYASDDTPIGIHPSQNLPGVEFATGSLALGISYGVGAALAAKMQNTPRRVFVLISDAECNEGLTWESAMFAAQHQLDNLYLIIDLNGQQALGPTAAILNNQAMPQRWQSFGWDVNEIDGHSCEAIISAVQTCQAEKNRPHVLIAHTTFGKGVSFMENQVKWHYWPMNAEEYQLALSELP